MKQGSKSMLEGVLTFVIGLALFLFTDGVETPVVTLTKVGVVLMCVGGVLVAMGLFQAMRNSRSVQGG
ncbi:DUF5708 family protein [Streptomyces sp. NPDC004111]|uniref:DUF5708 family protein n=1 Tax=Streptomyces sp. NPDC004111 TaxID=3364690 RepID=UPI003675791C